MNYSFIIPHKNVPDLLRKLLDSIPLREDTEVIVVDDHSDPAIVDFDSFPGKNRPQTYCYFMDESYGAGHARNVGIEHAKGKWLLFADADDYYTDKLPEVLDKYSDDLHSDMVIMNAQNVDEKGIFSPHRLSLYIDNYLNRRFYSEKVLRYQVWTPWCRMVKRDLINNNNLRYDEIPTGNDMMFCLNCSKYAIKIAVERDVAYNYLKPIGRSLTDGYRKEWNSIKSSLELEKRHADFCHEVGYIFMPVFFDLKRLAAENGYKEKYKELMKKEHYYNSYVDYINWIIRYVGQKMKVI